MSMLFGGAPAPQTVAATTPHETSLNVQSSSAGKVVAVVLGTRRIAGNLCWYGDFTAIAHQSGGGGGGGGGKAGGGGSGGGGSTSYTYTASTIVGLCSGEVQSIGKVWVTDDVVSLSGLGASVHVATGSLGQSSWPWLDSAHPSEALPYSGLSYVGIATADLGSSSSLPSWNWEVRGLGVPVETDDSGSYDISFSEAIALVVENTEWGCGLTGVMADMTDYSDWCSAQGFVMSDAFTDARSAREIIQDYCRATISEAVWSGDKLRIVPYADQVVVGVSSTYTPDLSPALVIDATILRPARGGDEGPLKVRRRDPADLMNYITVEFNDRADDYNTATVTATDDAHMATYGQRPGSSISAHFLSSATVAQHVADLVQGREIGVTATFEFGVGPAGALLEPMDIVWVTDPDPSLGITDYPVRVKEVTEDEAYSFTLTAEDIPGCVGAMVSRAVATGQGYRSQLNAIPADCNPPIIFEAPAALTTGGGLEVWAAISGSDSQWGGCQVWVSTDGDSYRRAGVVNGGARTGVLADSLASAADPDLSGVLSVDLSESRSTLSSGTQADADLFNTLCWVGGEFISYQSATLVASNAYDLTYLRRGAYGSAIAGHAAGSRFARIAGSVFRYSFTTDMIGATIHIKVLGFNQRGGGLQSLADVPAYSYAIQGPSLPGAVSEFSAQQNGNVVVFNWRAPSSGAAGYDIAYGPRGSTSLATMTMLTEAARGTEMTNASVPPGSWTLGIAAQNGIGVNGPLVTVDLDVTSTAQAIAALEQASEWSGSMYGFVRHWTGKLLPMGTMPADQYGWEVFDLLVPDPVASPWYEAAALDLGGDGLARVWASVDAILPDPAMGDVAFSLQIDSKSAAGAYSGTWSPWTIGTVTAAFVKARVVFDTSAGSCVLVGFCPTADADLMLDGGALSVGVPGTAITFAQPYRLPPRVQVTPGAGLTGASATSITKTGCVLHGFFGTAEAAGPVTWDSTGV